jgi:hypothetical protein
VIEAMCRTGLDVIDKYQKSSEDWLATNGVES